MGKQQKSSKSQQKGLFAIFTGFFIAFLLTIGILARAIGFSQNNSQQELTATNLVIVQNNTLTPVSDPTAPIKIEKIKMVITAYSSDVWQTDDTPFITASGKKVENGIVANNLLPFGTRIRIPEIYKEKVFIVEDRMHPSKGKYHLDIWFPSYEQAKSFGVKKATVEILKD